MYIVTVIVDNEILFSDDILIGSLEVKKMQFQ